MAQKSKFDKFVVFGMGKFGSSLAYELTKHGFEVLAVDEDENNINAAKEYVSQSVIADAADENVIKSLGLKNYDVAVVCVGDIEASILITLMCRQSGMGHIVAKAKNAMHKSILEKMGASNVVIPEHEMGKKMASILANYGVSDFFDLGNDFSILEIQVPQIWSGKTILELNLRKQFDVNVLLIKRKDEFITSIQADTMIKDEDIICVAGGTHSLEKFVVKINKMRD